jgi:hypothetical protein
VKEFQKQLTFPVNEFNQTSTERKVLFPSSNQKVSTPKRLEAESDLTMIHELLRSPLKHQNVSKGERPQTSAYLDYMSRSTNQQVMMKTDKFHS